MMADPHFSPLLWDCFNFGSTKYNSDSTQILQLKQQFSQFDIIRNIVQHLKDKVNFLIIF